MLEGIIASVFLIIVALIGFFLPRLASEFFNSHNPYLVLEVAGFLTYSTSEPGNISALIPVTQAADQELEFRIIPPISTGWVFSTYDNSDFAVAIGYCVEQNLWQQLGYDALNALINAVFAYFKGGGLVSDEAPLSSIIFNSIKFSSEMYAANTLQLAALNVYENYGLYSGNFVQNLATSFQSALGESAIFTGENVIETYIDSALFFVADFGGPIGFLAATAINFAINAIVTFIQYENVQSNEFARCYNYCEYKNSCNGNYFIYNNLLLFQVYYNPQFDIYDDCSSPELCNNQLTQTICLSYEQVVVNGIPKEVCTNEETVVRDTIPAYNSQNPNEDYIIKIELGYYNQTTGEFYYPEFLLLQKVGGNPFGYINVSVYYTKYS